MYFLNQIKFKILLDKEPVKLINDSRPKYNKQNMFFSDFCQKTQFCHFSYAKAEYSEYSISGAFKRANQGREVTQVSNFSNKQSMPFYFMSGINN